MTNSYIICFDIKRPKEDTKTILRAVNVNFNKHNKLAYNLAEMIGNILNELEQNYGQYIYIKFITKIN